jgi:hypothetical protein
MFRRNMLALSSGLEIRACLLYAGLSSYLLFNPEDGVDILPWNISWLSTGYTALSAIRRNLPYSFTADEDIYLRLSQFCSHPQLLSYNLRIINILVRRTVISTYKEQFCSHPQLLSYSLRIINILVRRTVISTYKEQRNSINSQESDRQVLCRWNDISDQNRIWPRLSQ